MSFMKKRYHRMIKLFLGFASIGTGLFIFFTVFKESLVFYHTPKEIQPKHMTSSQQIRIGGFVKKGSLIKGALHHFILEDERREILVTYRGILPSLFKEGTTAVVKGRFQDKTFKAEEVLAKHDEVYHPPSLKNQGRS